MIWWLNKMDYFTKMKQVHGIKNGKMNSAIIDCHIHIVDIGKLVRFKRFRCISYSDFHGGLSGLLLDKELDTMFHFTTHYNYIMIYPVKDENYNPQSFVDFYELIKKKIDSNAELMMYGEYQEKHKDDLL